MKTVQELLNKLNTTDETSEIEAKTGSSISRSIMETVCAFSNEPGLGGGYILLGVEKDESTLFPTYKVVGISNSDKLQLDLTTQCSANTFNLSVRPKIEVESFEGKLVLKILIPELPIEQKPLYFKTNNLPSGAFRRIGSSDQRCTDDDLQIFFNGEYTYDSSVVKESSLEDIDEKAIETYRNLRAKVNPYAVELTYDTLELLQALRCVKKENSTWLLTYTGLLVFGKQASLRRFVPMIRVDYIRVPGTEWIPDPEKRYTTIDMRGSLIELIQRSFSAIVDDLPKGFLLPDGKIQAESTGLPSSVLREALVNALIHRTYREHEPIQIIRYSNRIEIKNPGFSLKSDEQLISEPGSRNRNPFIATIFYETNLAETKGSGIRTMRSLMEKAGMAPPTFESDHNSNRFTVRLLFHHFLSEEDVVWLNSFSNFELNDSQKRGLIFVREVGAIDNFIYRQLNGCDILKASNDLRNMRNLKILEMKGKNRSAFYKISATILSNDNQFQILLDQFPESIQKQICFLDKDKSDEKKVNTLIISICAVRSTTLQELSIILKYDTEYLFKTYITPLITGGRISVTIPNIPSNDNNQSYKPRYENNVQNISYNKSGVLEKFNIDRFKKKK